MRISNESLAAVVLSGAAIYLISWFPKIPNIWDIILG